MKVLYVSHYGRPCYELEWFSQLPVEELRIIDVDFTKYPKNPPKHVRYCPVSYTDIPSLNSTAHLVRYRNYKKYINDVDVVIVLEIFSSLSYQFIQYCRRIGKPVVVLTYELISTHPIYKIFPYYFFTKRNLHNATKFVAVTHASKQHLVSLGVDGSKITVVYPGINTSLFRPRKTIKPRHAAIFVGKLEKHKGIDVVLQAYYETIKPHPERYLTIVGDGSYRTQVEKMVNEEDRVFYYPSIDNAKMPDILNKHSVFIMPARDTYRLRQKIGSEQFCFAAVEAMACGLAIVSTNCGAIPEVIGNINYICQQSELDKFSELVDKALKNKTPLIMKKNEKIAKEKYNKVNQAKVLHIELRRLFL